MNHRWTRLSWIFGGILLSIPGLNALGQVRDRPPTNLYDPRLGELRRASVKWEQSKGPTRRVVNQVVLVPDVATFFEAIGSWDDQHFFPILIDDANLVPKFIRAFQPERVIRFPGQAKATEGKETWNQAVEAVGRSWTRELPGPPEPPGTTSSARQDRLSVRMDRRGLNPRGDVVPGWIEPTPPGVVVSNPASPCLAGAVALAAGRFQPLLLWETSAKKENTLDEASALKLTLALETELSKLRPKYGMLGDDCDFLTLAAPYPERYHISGTGGKAGPAAWDDLVGRNRETFHRWAYAGRLTGRGPDSVYRAMCSLFLQPKSAILIDGYSPTEPGFRGYGMNLAAVKMPAELTTTLLTEAKADVKGWLRAIGQFNIYDLVFVNTQGNPTYFDLIAGSRAYSGDIPATVPAIVLMNHSFSAAAPDDPNTLAGAWLTGGAFVYFGSMYEPYIQGFRTPSLIVSLLNESLPISSVVRMGPEEHPAFGTPWRLVYLGDPLYRYDPRAARTPRLASWDLTQTWPMYSEDAPPPATASPTTKLAWVAKMTILEAAKSKTGSPSEVVETMLLGIRRETVPPNLRVVLDDLRIDSLPRSTNHAAELLRELGEVPASEITPALGQVLLHARFSRFRRAIERSDWTHSLAIWQEIQKSSAPLDLKEYVTKQAGALASQENHLVVWKAKLNAVIQGKAESSETKYIREELARIEKAGARVKAPASIRRGG